MTTSEQDRRRRAYQASKDLDAIYSIYFPHLGDIEKQAIKLTIDILDDIAEGNREH